MFTRVAGSFRRNQPVFDSVYRSVSVSARIVPMQSEASNRHFTA